MVECRICKNAVAPFMTFGKMPIANGFLASSNPSDEYFFELAPIFCDGCKTFQIAEQPEPEKMFHDHYAFFSRTSKRMVQHFQEYASWVKQTYLSDSNPFVVELGSNDGILLENFARDGIQHLGVEPSANVAEEARKYGVNTISEFFSPTIADKIVAEYGQADVLMAANVMCHIPDLNQVAIGAKNLLKPTGVLIFEDPYLGDMIAKTSYDQIYDEHVYIFSAHSVANIFGRQGFELIDVKHQETHGGSMRYILAKKGARAIQPSVAQVLEKEKKQGLCSPEAYQQFKSNCELSKKELVDILKKCKLENRRVVGYAATSKSTTVLNYCGIGPDLIDYICDTTPLKQNTYTPGMHIPVRAYEDFANNQPETALLFAWNHKDEIMQKEKSFVANGGRFLVYVPAVMEV
ncbi:MAG: class I SAM-dependent methyltransferase [Gammaproteobacteria bacterium]|nr:class I SAM-dependent methyltransferase [Gammaproteobacteria bacterium]